VNLTAWLTTPIISQAFYNGSLTHNKDLAQNKKAERLRKDDRHIQNNFTFRTKRGTPGIPLGIPRLTSSQWESAHI